MVEEIKIIVKFIKGKIEGIYVIEPNLFQDERGYFFESFHYGKFAEQTGFTAQFVQENESFSSKSVLRGLHFQAPPFAQAKLVRVVRGEVLDVAVDIRKNSSTYGQFQSILLSESNNRMFFIPEGFAHGFIALTDNVIFQYKCSAYYNPASEAGIFPLDSALGIDWKLEDAILSKKDEKLPYFNNFVSPFN